MGLTRSEHHTTLVTAWTLSRHRVWPPCFTDGETKAQQRAELAQGTLPWGLDGGITLSQFLWLHSVVTFTVLLLPWRHIRLFSLSNVNTYKKHMNPRTCNLKKNSKANTHIPSNHKVVRDHIPDAFHPVSLPDTPSSSLR